MELNPRINIFFLLLYQIISWKIADQLLHEKKSMNSCFFAAQTLRTKISVSKIN